jgi:Ca2+-binding RTX toxin-like protein
MTAFDFSLVKNTSIAFNTAADTLNFSTESAASLTLTAVGSDLVITTGSDSITLTGAAMEALTTNNVTFTDGSALVIGDNSANVTFDALGNNVGNGTAKDDQLIGLAGADTLNGLAGNNKIDGGAGADTINVADGNNVIYGGSDADAITAGNGDNVIYGGTGIADSTDGNDTIIIGSGSNTVYGNAGDDTIQTNAIVAAGKTVLAYGGLGNDVLDFDGNANLGNFEIHGSVGDDDIDVRTTGDVTVYGGNGIADANSGVDNVDIEGTGNSVVYTNSGDDTILVSGSLAAGKSTQIWAGLGDDSVTLNNASADGNATTVIYGNTGNDTIDIAAFDGAATIYGGNGIADSTDGADTITLGTANATLYANSGNDTITAAAGAATAIQTIYAGSGDDSITAGGGADGAQVNIVLGAGNNSVTTTGTNGLITVSGFNTANDVITFATDETAATLTVAGLGTANTIIFDDDAVANNTRDAGEEIITLNGLSGDLNGTNFVVGNGASKLLTNIFGAAAATLTGGISRDYLVAGDLGDTLVSGNTATGAASGDKLIGGAGNDTFQLTAAVAGALDTTGHTITGGNGTDVLEITDAVAVAMDDDDFPASVTSIETLKLSNVTGHSVAVGVKAVAAGLTTIDASALTSGPAVISIDATAFDSALTYLGTGGDDSFARGAGAGVDSIDLGAGSDAFSINLTALTAADTISGGAGTDSFTLTTAGNVTDALFTNVTGFESLTLGNDANTLTGGAEIAEAGFTTINGGTGADVINMASSTGALTINGGTGADSITAGAGADTIDVGADAVADTLNYNAIADFGDTVANFNATADLFTFANSFAADGLVAGVQGVSNVTYNTSGEAQTLTDLTSAANADVAQYNVSLDTSTLGTTLYAAIDAAIQAGSAATGAGFVLVDNGTDSALLYDADFSTAGNLTLVAYLTGVADAQGYAGVTIAA